MNESFRSRIGLSLVEVVVAIFIIGVLVGMVLPAIQSVRESTKRAECSNKVRQIAMAVTNFEAVNRVFPSGINSREHPQKPHLSWLGQLLDYIELASLAAKSDAEFRSGKSPFSGPGLLIQTHVDLFNCPADPRPVGPRFTHDFRMVALTSYVGACGTDYRATDGVFYRNSRTRTAEITDGLSNTILIGERPPSADDWYGWWYAGRGQADSGSPDMLLGTQEVNDNALHAEECPTGPYRFSVGQIDRQCDLFHFWSTHPGGAWFARVDGSLHFHAYEIDKELLRNLATRSGGEMVGEY